MQPMVIFFLCMSSPALGQEAVCDAFGIRAAGPSPRENWAGWEEKLASRTITGSVVPAGVGLDVLIYLGAKSLTAGGKTGQVAALVLDEYGNLVFDGTAVTLTTNNQAVIRPTQNGIAARRFSPGTVSGQYHAGAAITGRQSTREEYEVQPDLSSMTAMWRDDPVPIRAEDMHLLETLPLVDRFGNRTLDGVGGEAILIHEVVGSPAVSLVPLVTVGGIAQGQLLVRDMPYRAEAHLVVNQQTLAKRAVIVARPAALGPLGVTAVLDASTAETQLTVGPFLTAAGYTLNDGSPVTLIVTPEGREPLRLDAWVFEGTATVLVLADSADYPLDVEVTSALGVVRQTIAVPQEVSR